jgi:hypothetical protein
MNEPTPSAMSEPVLATPPAQVMTSSLAVWSLVLGIVSLVACGFLTAVPAVICGHMARSRIRLEPQALSGDGMAIAGLVMGYVCVGLSILAIAVLVGLMFFASAETDPYVYTLF